MVVRSSKLSKHDDRLASRIGIFMSALVGGAVLLVVKQILASGHYQ